MKQKFNFKIMFAAMLICGLPVFADPNKSWPEHENLRKIEEEIYKGL